MTTPNTNEPGTAVVVQNAHTAAPAVSARVGLLRPVAAPTEVLAAHNDMRAMIAQALQEGRDYGIIPGTGTANKPGKKVLLKPGAERLNAAFGLTASYVVVEREIDHDRTTQHVKREKIWANRHQGDKSFKWGDEYMVTAYGLYRYVVECVLTHRDTGVVVGRALGSCSTMETKYCDRPRDLENTVVKMASKRALIAADLNALGLSDEFTQDVDEPGIAEAAGIKTEPDEAEAARLDAEREANEAKELAAMTALDAEAFIAPGKLGKDKDGNAKMLSSYSDKRLGEILTWARGVCEENEAKGAPSFPMRKLLRACELIEKARFIEVAQGEVRDIAERVERMEQARNGVAAKDTRALMNDSAEMSEA